MRVLLDLNVILDALQNRGQEAAAAQKILSLIRTGKFHALFPTHGLTTVYYLLNKFADRATAMAAVDFILAHFEIIGLDLPGWRSARSLAMPDFEDAAVVSTALTGRADLIVTGNIRDFALSPVACLTPTEFLSRFFPVTVTS